MAVGIVAFAFGTPDSIFPNWLIAKITLRKARELNAPIYTQRDIRINVLMEPRIEVRYIKEKPDNPPPTLRIARGAVQWAKQHRLTELWVVAAKPHLWRVLRDVQQSVQEDGALIEVHVCEEIKQYSKDSWFWPYSTQKRTRSWKNWWPRELILRLMPFFIYKRVAS